MNYCRLENIALFYLLGQLLSAIILSFRLQIKRKWHLLKDVLSIVAFFAVSCGVLNLLQMSLKDTALCSPDKIYALFDLLLCGIVVFFIFLCFLLFLGGEDRKVLYNLFVDRFKSKK